VRFLIGAAAFTVLIVVVIADTSIIHTRVRYLHHIIHPESVYIYMCILLLFMYIYIFFINIFVTHTGSRPRVMMIMHAPRRLYVLVL
jgi:hypothetical protein